MNNASEIISLNEMWEQTDSQTIADNVESLLDQNGFKSSADKWERLMEITNSSKHAVYAWMNRGRQNVKIPFLKLCEIAKAYDVEVETLLIGGSYMFERKFAVTRTVKNNEVVLKFFGEDQKQEALAYGAEVAKTNKEGVIACIEAQFDENGNMKNRECRVFEVWES